MTLWIADISNWQAGISPEQIVSEGYTAVICKASEGTTYKDPQFEGWIPRIRNAGGIPGAYHFLRSGDGSAQAHAFFDRVHAAGGPDGFLVACDNEKDANWSTTVDFFNTWRSLSGGHPLMMYTGAWWWNPRGWNGSELTPYLWDSHYVSGVAYGSELYAKVPGSWWYPGYGGWSTATMLQFSSSAKVAGQQIDVSAYQGSLDELKTLSRGSVPNPPVGNFPTWGGRYFSYPPVMRGDDVHTWQQRMRDRGWTIGVDGAYGQQSKNVCLQFQREKGLTADGIVGPATWNAAWQAPVTR